MDNSPLAILQFKRYVVKRIEFIHSYDPRPGTRLQFDLSQEVRINDDFTAAEVSLGCDVVPQAAEHGSPFKLSVELSGFFALDVKAQSEAAVSLVSKNAVAILFPYLRSTIGVVTQAANIAPVILPTINVAEFMAGGHDNPAVED